MNFLDTVVIKDIRGARCLFNIESIEYIQESVSLNVYPSIGLKSGKKIHISREKFDELFKAWTEDD